MMVDWYKDAQPKMIVSALIQKSLDSDLPQCYGREVFADKTQMLLNNFVDMAEQGYGWGA